MPCIVVYPCPCILIITHWMALKGIAEQSQRNAAGRHDSRYVRWGRPKVRVDSCRRLNAECLYGRWIDLNQQTNDLCALKALKESCENCVAACLPAKLTKFASLSLAAREPCGKVFLWDAGPIYFGGSLAAVRPGLALAATAVDQFKTSAQLPVAYSDPH